MNRKDAEQREIPDEQAASSKAPEVLRQDIEHTREELGDTVEALSHKADVKAQFAEKADERKADLRERTEALKAKVSGARGRADPGRRQAGGVSSRPYR